MFGICGTLRLSTLVVRLFWLLIVRCVRKCAEMCGANLVKRVNLVILKYTICFKLLLCKHGNEYCKCYCGEYQNEKLINLINMV